MILIEKGLMVLVALHPGKFSADALDRMNDYKNGLPTLQVLQH